MKIITWNINGYRAITGQNKKTKYGEISQDNTLFSFINEEEPDILCLQEIKASEEQISDELKSPSGYFSFYNTATSKKGYSGVAVFTKINPEKVIKGIGIEKFDIEGRVLELHFKDFILFNIYFPNGKADSERLDYKLEFYDEMTKIFLERVKTGKSLVITGDYNTAHKEIDLARPKENEKTSGFLAEERIKLDKFIDIGLIDSFREFEKAGGHYTWWSQRGRARENNIGWRIDYFFVSSDLKEKLIKVEQMPDKTGSDHCPIVLDINL